LETPGGREDLKKEAVCHEGEHHTRGTVFFGGVFQELFKGGWGRRIGIRFDAEEAETSRYIGAAKIQTEAEGIIGSGGSGGKNWLIQRGGENPLNRGGTSGMKKWRTGSE